MGEQLTAGEVCTRSVTVAFRNTTLGGAARLMRDNNAGCLVVVDEVHGLRIVVGLLTDRDIVTDIIAAEVNPDTLRVEDVMTTELVTARETDSLIDLLRSMRRKAVRRIPVVGARAELVGLVTLDDLLDIVSEELVLLVGAIDSQSQRERPMRRLAR
ncbi:MAG: CBS domain-containing protein [Burkholderiaceae bacterium]